MKLSFNNDNCSVNNFAFLKSFSHIDGKTLSYPTGDSKESYAEMFCGPTHIKLDIDSDSVFLGQFAPRLDLSTGLIYFDASRSEFALYVLFNDFYVKFQ